jgi:hypothetical protein
MDMLELEGMDMVEEQNHPTNHRLGGKCMNMVGSNMVKMDGMDMVEKHFHPMNHRLKVEGMDTVDTGMGEDRAAQLEVVEREPEGVVLTRHWIGDRAARHRRTHREWEEVAKPRCSKNQPTFTTQDSNCTSPLC